MLRSCGRSVCGWRTRAWASANGWCGRRWRMRSGTGVASVYLLTTTAGGYFPRLGFRLVERSEIPTTVQGSVEFTAVCPASALAMVYAG